MSHYRVAADVSLQMFTVHGCRVDRLAKKNVQAQPTCRLGCAEFRSCLCFIEGFGRKEGDRRSEFWHRYGTMKGIDELFLISLS